MTKAQEKAHADIEYQADRYDESASEPANNIDREPFYNASMEKEEKRINDEADARARGEITDDQLELFPPKTKEEIEEEPHVRSAKVKLILTVELEGDKPVTLPLLVGSMPSDRVQEMLGIALISRRNKRRIEAALDLPEKEEELSDRPVSETLAEVEDTKSTADSEETNGESADKSGVGEGFSEPQGSEADRLGQAEGGGTGSILENGTEASSGTVRDAEPIVHVDTVDHEAIVAAGERF